MHIVHIVPSLRLSFGGPSYTVPSLCNALAQQNVKVSLLTISDHQKDESTIGEDMFETTRVPGLVSNRFRISYSPFFYRHLKMFCEQNRIDIIHNHGLWMPVNHSAAAVARSLSVPLITSCRGMMTKWAWNNASWKKKTALALYQENDLQTVTLFHSTADVESSDLRALGYPQPIAEIPNGVDEPPWDKLSDERVLRPNTALFLSRIHPKKGLPRLIEAWDRLRPEGWNCLIAGPDEDGHRKQLEKMVTDRRLEKRISFKGMINGDERWRYFRDADLFVLPTNTENFGVVIAEALAAGTPVITTKGAPWLELETHRCGWWTEVSVNGIYGALKSAISLSKRDRSAMGERGRRLVKDRYSWDSIAKSMSEVYAWLLCKQDKPDTIIE